jgi:hypothetical protein
MDAEMDISIDVWLRGDVHATTHEAPGVGREPRAWTDADVTHLLVAMLRAMKRASDPNADPAQPVALRGFSWIVNPFEAGGVVVAIEMSLGAAVAGPFDVPESVLNEKIQRVLDADKKAGPGPGSSSPSPTTIH